MTKAGSSKLHKHPNCDTLYHAIPSAVVSDSTFPFKAGEKVTSEIYTGGRSYYFEENVLVLKKLDKAKETTKKHE